MKTWHINYRGWRITRDPCGKLACYRLEGDGLWWCYFGGKVAEIKEEIDRREYVAALSGEEG